MYYMPSIDKSAGLNIPDKSHKKIPVTPRASGVAEIRISIF
jgi:hypothetical protein